jgi:hypothetical protein
MLPWLQSFNFTTYHYGCLRILPYSCYFLDFTVQFHSNDNLDFGSHSDSPVSFADVLDSTYIRIIMAATTKPRAGVP